MVCCAHAARYRQKGLSVDSWVSEEIRDTLITVELHLLFSEKLFSMASRGVTYLQFKTITIVKLCMLLQ